jgi:hypothetical protein
MPHPTPPLTPATIVSATARQKGTAMVVDQPPAFLTTYASPERDGGQRYRIIWATPASPAPQRRAPRPFPRLELPVAPKRRLADDAAVMAGRSAVLADDVDAEVASWPECTDQTRLWDALAGSWHEDDEDDDPDTAIDDEPHDARDEDGV